MLLTLIIALLTPWLLGVLCLRPLRLPPMLALSAGVLLGMIGLSILLRGWSALGLPLQFTPLVFLLWLMALCLTPMAVKFRYVPSSLSKEGVRKEGSYSDLAFVSRLVFSVLLVLLILRYAAFAGEIAWRPLLAWDAWASWAVKAKVWFYQQHIVPFVSNEVWLKSDNKSLYTVIANDYPATIPLLQTWAALAWGEWLETAANTPWLLCALALGLGFYSYCRMVGANALRAMLFTYVLLSIPIINTHIALPGYADIWLATCYGLAALAFLHWCQSGDYGQFWLGVLLALCLPLIKVDGTVWTLSLLFLLVTRILGRWLGLLLVLAVISGLLWFIAGGIQLGRWQITPELMELPYIGRYEWFYTANWTAVRDQLLFGGSWHILWYLAPLSLMALLFPKLRTRSPSLFYGALLLLFDLLVLYVLFFFTQAARWALDATSINRLFMHITPLAVYLLFLLSQLLIPHTMQQSAELPDQLKNPAAAH